MSALFSSVDKGQKVSSVRALRRIVFLDFDGVLVNQKSWYVRSGMRATGDPECVKALNKITDATGAAIVVTSTWRIGTPVSELRSILRSWGVTGLVIASTPRLQKTECGLWISESRGREIQVWMDGRREKLEAFVILDDDSDMAHLSSNLVQTEFTNGLTELHADRAIAVLQSANATNQQATETDERSANTK